MYDTVDFRMEDRARDVCGPRKNFVRKGNQELRKKVDLSGFIPPLLPSYHDELARVPQDRAHLSGDLDSDRKVHRSERGPLQVRTGPITSEKSEVWS